MADENVAGAGTVTVDDRRTVPVTPGWAPDPASRPGPGSAAFGGVASFAGDRGKDAAILPDERTRLLVDELLEVALEAGASDVHLSAGAPPMMRVHGHMEPIRGHGPLHPMTIQRSVFTVLGNSQRERFESTKELDCSYSLPGRARFRVNVMQQRGAVGAVFRVVPWEIKSLAQLGLPERLAWLSALPRGLVLVTGPTGSGKSTTLATLVDIANRTRRGHIVTIEDPIEFLFDHKGCLVDQREVGEDTSSFAEALRHVLRQDPDIIVIGEMRDLETMSAALTAAETGHLVFGTLHTRSAQEAVTRIIDAFPAGAQEQVRVQLSVALQGVVAQELLPTADGMGRIPAVEVLVATAAVRNVIRENKVAQLAGILESSGQHGMETLDQNLARLVVSGLVSVDVAREVCRDRLELDKLVLHAQLAAAAATSGRPGAPSAAVGGAGPRLSDTPSF